MKWIYNVRNENLWKKDGFTGIQQVYLRAAFEKNGELYGSRIVDLRITAFEFIDFVRKNGDIKGEYFDEFKKKAGQKEYHIAERPIDDEDKEIFLNKADIYVQKKFTREQFLHWVQVYLKINGYRCDLLTVTDFEKFAFDVDPFLRLFTVENLKKFEHVLGKEWWLEKIEEDPGKKKVRDLINKMPQN